MIHEALQAHAVACREAEAVGRERPQWTRGSLEGFDAKLAKLARINLTGADLRDIDLTGANLTGAELTGPSSGRTVLWWPSKLQRQ